MLYQIKRGSQTIVETEINGTHSREAPALDNLQVTFTSPNPVILDKGDTITYNNNTYKLLNYSSHKNSTNNYNYQATFESISFKASEILCLGYDENNNLTLPTYPINADINTLVDLCVANLNRVDTGWSKGQLSLSNTEYFEIENESVMSVLAKMSGTFNMPFDIQNKVINFGIVERETNNTLEYGKGKGFTSIQDRTDPNKPIINVLYATGSSENLPSGYGKRRLTIEPLINQASIVKYGRLEGSVINDNIRPTTKGKLVRVIEYKESILDSDVGYITYETDIIKFTDSPLKGILNAISGQTNGQSFPINVLSVEGESFQRVSIYMKKFKLNTSVYPQVNTEFNITDIDLAPAFVTDAENRLREFAQGYLNEVSQKITEIDATCDPLYDFSWLKLNDVITIKDADLGIDSKFIVVGINTPIQPFQPIQLKLSVKGRVYSNLSLPSGQNSNIIQGAINNGVQDTIELIKAERIEVGGFIIEGDRIVSQNGALEINGVNGSIMINYPNGVNGIFIGIDNNGDPVFIMSDELGNEKFSFNKDGIVFANFVQETYTELGRFVLADTGAPYLETTFLEKARLDTSYIDNSCNTTTQDNPNGFPPFITVTSCGAKAYTYDSDFAIFYSYNAGWNVTSVANKQYEKYIFTDRNKLGDRVADGWYYAITTNPVMYGQIIGQNEDGTYRVDQIQDNERQGKITFVNCRGGELLETKEVKVQFLLSNNTGGNEINEQPKWSVIN